MITDRTDSIHDPIRKNVFPLFSCPQPKIMLLMMLLYDDVALFSRLYINVRDMSAFFSHENHPFPPSLSDHGKLHFGKKSDLLDILVKDIHDDPPNSIDVKLFDGAAVVHLLPITNIVTFDYHVE